MNFAVHYVGDGYSTDAKLMGRQAVGKSLFRALSRRWSDGDVFGFGRGASRVMMDHLTREGFTGRLVWREQGSVSPPPGFPGAVYHPGPIPTALAHDRNREGPAAYSLLGVTHTLSSLGAMDSIGDLAGAPFQPWDALICTSTAAATLVRSLITERRAWLAEHFGATRFSEVELPVIPLGLDVAAQRRPGAEIAAARQALGLEGDEVVFLFAGRLSFHAKANPAPVYIALERIAAGRRLVCIEAGQFHNDAIADAYRDAQVRLAPSVRFLHAEGGDGVAYRRAWCAADVFVSISDNIQETFGITPVEAMAAGLPVIVSDWNGYRDTVRDGRDGFRIPVTAPPEGGALDLALRHALHLDTYDRFIGQYSMATAADLSVLARRMAELADSPELRARMGDSGRARAEAEYDWAVVLARYLALAGELGRLRSGAAAGRVDWPLRPDPARLFGHFPTHRLAPDWTISATAGREAALEDLLSLRMTSYVLDPVRLPPDMIRDLHRLALGGPRTLADLMSAAGGGGRARLRAVLWLAKLGLVELAPPA
ncbi:MAG: glycosyltransferase family 4 protein [Phenylobacterium sp.]